MIIVTQISRLKNRIPLCIYSFKTGLQENVLWVLSNFWNFTDVQMVENLFFQNDIIVFQKLFFFILL